MKRKILIIIGILGAFPASANSQVCLRGHQFEEFIKTGGHKLIASGNLLGTKLRFELYARADGSWYQVHRMPSGNGFQVCFDEFGTQFEPKPSAEKPA